MTPEIVLSVTVDVVKKWMSPDTATGSFVHASKNVNAEGIVVLVVTAAWAGVTWTATSAPSRAIAASSFLMMPPSPALG